ncbi:related to protein transport membrane glycoprotein Sec20 [Phialocephala subalpina]|uniref:Related to protein transport membrane glycoprotein Sec20 n=1 Tax=Phialocephala subalpina TaxID=576137 RepID=A0A1L7WCH9_9HELO|nr:related to protein transport membrane glycoprotein Sec20 [Phialocephala subalpina]
MRQNMSFEAVSDQLKALKESNAQLKDLIDRLANINFQPGSVPLDDEDDNVAIELTSEIHQTLKEQDEDLELLLEEAEDLDAGKEHSELWQQKEELKTDVTRAITELKAYQIEFRKAQIAAKRKLEEAQRAERDLLLQSYVSPPRTNSSSPAPSAITSRKRNKQNTTLTEEEKTVSAASDVTRALRRTHDMMESELARSQFAHETLTESTAALAQLSESYSMLDTLLSNSRNLLGTLLRSQKSDTWYLESAFYVLAVTIGWLVWRRLLYGPMWWLLWFPVKIFKSLMGVFAAMGMLGGSNPGSEVGVSPGISEVVGGQTVGVVHSSGTRGPRPSMGPPGAHNVRVGGGGRGAPMQESNYPSASRQEGSGESMVEQVGKIIDEGQQEPVAENEVLERGAQGEPESEVQRNPKKRMWEEPKEAAKEVERKKDEL